MSYMRIIGIGRLTRDPEYKEGDTFQLCSFSIAVSDKVKGVDKVFFLDCKSWGKQATNIKNFVTKGSQVMIDGKLELEEWQDTQGIKRSKFIAHVDRVEFLSPKKDVQAPMPLGKDVKMNDPFSGQGIMIDDDGLPF